MSKITLLILVACFSKFTLAQVGIGTTTPSDASMLEVSSSATGNAPYRGFMPPRVPLTSDLASINASINDVGLQVFVLETGCLNLWNGATWVAGPCVTVVNGSVVEFSVATQSQVENVPSIDFTFIIANPSLTIPIQLLIVADVYGDIDESTAQFVTIPAGLTTYTATGVFAITNDIVPESNENVVFTASVVSGGLGATTMGTQNTNTLTILDDDSDLALPFRESFETDGNGTRYSTSTPEAIDSLANYFSRGEEADFPGVILDGVLDGTFFFGAQDLDDVPGSTSTQQTLIISGIDITGAVNLQLDILIAEDDDGATNEDWDGDDFMHIDYQIDGAGYQNLLWVEGQNASNQAPSIDNDFDGIGDGDTITDTWSNFTRSIPLTGVTLDIKITFEFQFGDEDIAIDNIRITSN